MPANKDIYSPLNESQQEIRLVKLSPTARTQTRDASVPLILDMTVASLSDPSIKYNAGSYVWGEPNVMGSITINGHDLDITQNLYLFLLRYRALVFSQPESDIGRYPLWVDALCIDQSNVPEKNQQTQRMGDIYSLANVTLAWLGEGGPRSKICLDTITAIAPRIITSSSPTGWLCAEQIAMWESSEPNSMPDFWAGLDFLMFNSYWQRAWIIQELILSRNTMLLCGDATSSLEALWQFYKAMTRLRGQPRPLFLPRQEWDLVTTDNSLFFTSCAPLRKQLLISETIHTSDVVATMSEKQVFGFWTQLIVQCTHLKATDVRDKLYCLLGFMYQRVRPDYALSAEEVYTGFAEQWIQCSEDLTLLKMAGHFQLCDNDELGQPQTLLLPSWAPNWDKLSCTANAAWLWSVSSSQAGPQADAGWSQLNLKLSHSRRSVIDGRCLQAHGVKYSSVSSTASCSTKDGSWLRYCQHAVEKSGGRPYVTGIPMLQALARLLFLDCGVVERKSLSVANGLRYTSAPPVLVHEVGRCFLLFIIANMGSAKDVNKTGVSDSEAEASIWRGLGFDPNLADLRPFFDAETYNENAENMVAWNQNMTRRSELGETKPLMSILLDMSTAMDEYVAVTTTSGHLGWCRRGVTKGDIIAVLDGCPMPVVLRSVGDTHHILIGSAFVLGLMHGEAVEAAQAGEADVEQFRIW